MAGKVKDDTTRRLPVKFKRIADGIDHEEPVPRTIEQTLSVVAYGPDGYVEQEVQNPEQVQEYLNKWPVVWINVDGLGDYSAIRKFGQMFGLHQLAIEDVINLQQRAKVDDYDDHQYIVARLVAYDRALATEQISLFLTNELVLSVSESSGRDDFDTVRERIRKDRGNIRRARADYLAYALLDAAIDGYFPVLERYGEQLDALEDEIIQSPSKSTIIRMHGIKRELLATRRAIWPLRELINSLVRDESPLIAGETRVYLRDTYDHAVRVLDLVEIYRELSSDLRDVYLSSVSNRLNEIMKVLTVITVIFIPPTFIAAIYGMNFNPKISPFNLPELNWYFGYPYALALMAILVVIQIVFMYRRGWLIFDEFSPEQPGSEPANK